MDRVRLARDHLVGWTANVRLPRASRAGWRRSSSARHRLDLVLLGWSGYMKATAVGASLAQFGLHLPVLSDDVVDGLGDIWPLLVTAIPLGIYNFTEGMNNVESAAAAGDNYNLRHILLADGVGAVVGSASRQPVPARGLYRASGLEGGRRPDRLFARDRGRDRGRLRSSGWPRCCWRSSRWSRSCRSCCTSVS